MAEGPVKAAMPPNTAGTQPSEEHQDHGGGTAASRRARFQAGSAKVAWSRPAHQYPEGA